MSGETLEGSSMEFSASLSTAKPVAPTEPDDYGYFNISAEEYMVIVYDHVFPQPYEWCLIVLNAMVLFIGLLGNFLVCYVVYRNHSMQTVTNIFIVNLAVADFCVLLFCLPPTVAWDVSETWFFGNFPCKLILYFQTVSVSVSVLTLTAISVDRWYAICTPLKFKSTPARAKSATVVIWILSLLLDLPEVLYLETKPFNFGRPDISTIFLTTCIPTWGDIAEGVFVLAKVIMLFMVPLLFIAVAYFQIIKVLWRQDLPEEGVRSQMTLASEIQIRSRRKAAKMLVAVVVLFGLFYLPVHVISIARIFNMPNNETNKIISQLSHLLIYANSAINPLIYNFMSGKFRREFKKAIFCISSPDDIEPRLHYRTTSTRTHRV